MSKLDYYTRKCGPPRKRKKRFDRSLTLEDVNKIPILKVLEKLGVTFKDTGNETVIIGKDGHATRRVINVSENYVNDWSKDRPSGGPFAFIKGHLGFEAKEVFDWIKESFNSTKKSANG